MRLDTFIQTDMEKILEEWEAFAATMLPAAASMTPLELRDHAREIMKAVVVDLRTPQTKHAQAEKSKGRSPVISGAPETAAQTHALLRAKSGFDINQLIAEYRALRASVLRLYFDSDPPAEDMVDDVVRFNEAIDQAVTESVTIFSEQVETARNLLMAMLGHDMRSPLNTIVMTANYLAASDAGEKISEAAARLIRSGAAIRHLLDDLVDFNRTRLGLGLKISPADVDLAVLAADEVQQLGANCPVGGIKLQANGDTSGFWDGARFQQLIRNLVCNALTHGAKDSPVVVTITGRERDVVCEVANSGPAIDEATLRRIFKPFERGMNEARDRGAEDGLGLGLYIVEHIATAHGGQVAARSTDGETVFSVTLPRCADYR